MSCRGLRGRVPVRRALRATHGGDPRRAAAAALAVAPRSAEWLGVPLVLPRHWLLLACTWVAWLAQRLRLVPDAVRPAAAVGPLARAPLDVPVGGAPDAWLFTGCVMDAWLRDTHRSAARVHACDRRDGRATRPRAAACCGALHLHAGRVDEARRLGRAA